MRVKREREEKEEKSGDEKAEQTAERESVSPRVQIEPWRPPKRLTARKTTATKPPQRATYITVDDGQEDEKNDGSNEAVQPTQRQQSSDSRRDKPISERRPSEKRIAAGDQERKESGSERGRGEEKEERKQTIDSDERKRREKVREMKEQEKRRREGEEEDDDDSRDEQTNQMGDRRRVNGGEKVRGDERAVNETHKRPVPAASSAAVASRSEPPKKEKPVDLSKMTKTERREYQQKHNHGKLVGREVDGEREQGKAVPSKKTTIDGKAEAPVRPVTSTREGKRRRADRDDDSADEEEEQYADALEGSPLKPPRTRSSRSTTAANGKPSNNKSSEERVLEQISESHALPASFPSVRGGEDKGSKADLCCVCFYGYAFGADDAPDDERDEIMQCSSCRMNIHESCYGVSASKLPGDDFVCILCQAGMQGQVRCALCRQVTSEAKKGAFKPVQEESRLRRDRGAWAHIACALWVPGCGFAAVGIDSRAEVTGIDYLSDELYNKSTTCALCNNREGVKMKCFNTYCEIHFHPLCGLRHEWIEDFFYYLDGDYVTHQDYEYVDNIKIHKPYCKWHDPKDRHGLRGREQQRKTKEEEEEEARQEMEVRRRADARKKQRLEQSATERVLRQQDKLLSGLEQEEGESERKVREDASMAEQSRRALQRIREQQTLTVNGSSVKQDRLPSPARSTSPSADPLAAGREKARALLTEQVGKKRAVEIEEELHRIHPPDIDHSLPASQLPLVLSTPYKQKLLSVLANLRHNEQLCEDVLERKVTAAQLVAMDERLMADERLRAEREEAKAEDTEEHIRRNEVRTVRRKDGAIVQLREDTLEEVKEDEGTDTALMADEGAEGVEGANEDDASVFAASGLTNGHGVRGVR